MKKIVQLFSFIGIASFLISSCSSEYRGYDKSESGTYYKYYIHNEGENAKIGDEISFHLRYTLNDSVLFDSHARPVSKLIVPAELYKGDIYNCFTLMTAGDSASFIIEADSFFLITAGLEKIPDFIEPKSKLYADVNIISIKLKEDIEVENAKLLSEYKTKELEAIKNFKIENKINQEFIKNTGVFYKAIKKGSGKLPNPTDIITVKYDIKDLNGRIIYNSNVVKEDVTFECLSENSETKGFNLIISKMYKGDKASFIVPSSLAFAEVGIPNRLQPYTPLNYTIEILDIQEKALYKSEKGKQNKSFIDTENEKISSYLKNNNISEKPRESGLYYIETIEGIGRLVKNGDNVKVHYTLYNLDGKKIDSSVDRGSPFTFVVGQGQVIAGWDEALTLMKKGGKATLIIPSKIAYGERKRSEDILPYTPLRFEVELIEIVK